MLYDYIIENFSLGEPIFLSELPGKSKNYLRQEMKKLVDEGRMERLYNGVYFVPYKTILGTKGKISVEKYVEKKFLSIDGKIAGYITGLHLANLYGFTTQSPSCIEVCSNNATTKQRKISIDGMKVIIYKPVTEITRYNKDALQFLDMMTYLDKYSELTGESLKEKLNDYKKKRNLDFNIVKKYLYLYPDCVYRNIYNGGLMSELV